MTTRTAPSVEASLVEIRRAHEARVERQMGRAGRELRDAAQAVAAAVTRHERAVARVQEAEATLQAVVEDHPNLTAEQWTDQHGRATEEVRLALIELEQAVHDRQSARDHLAKATSDHLAKADGLG